MESTEEIKNKPNKHNKRNIKLFPIYKAISWDLLFYFPILFLFLTQVKGLSPTQVLLADAFNTLSNTFWQIPVTRLVDRVGKKNSLILGNILYSLAIFCMIFMRNFHELLMIQFIYALGYAIKGICESNILYDSLPKVRKRGKLFSQIDGKSTSYHYIFDSIAAIIAGFTFAINGYIPMILCFLCCITATILSFNFIHTTDKENNEKVEVVTLPNYIKQLVESFRFFLKSKRLRSLIIFNAISAGLLSGIVNLRSSMLSEMQLPEQYFGIIFAALQFVSAITSRQADKVQNTFKNKTLSYLTLPITMSCIFIGFIGKDPLSRSSVILIFLLYLVQYAIKGPYYSLISRYLNNFTNRSIRPKISALQNLSSNFFTAMITLLCAFLLDKTTTANTFIIIGCIATIIVVLLLDYMRDKVGLKPTEYSKEDLKYYPHKYLKQKE